MEAEIANLLKGAGFKFPWNVCIARLGAWFIRALGGTLRIRVSDPLGCLSGAVARPVIYAYWHNQMLVMPILFLRHYRNRKGLAVLISQSRDGSLIANVIARFGIGVVRGSSSRRGAAALLAMTECIQRGLDVNVTPDGPRGPRYRLGPGVIFLAEKTGAPIVPVRAEYSRCIRLRSWDRFIVPLPFSRVDVAFGDFLHIPPATTEEAFEAERLRVERIMQPAMP